MYSSGGGVTWRRKILRLYIKKTCCQHLYFQGGHIGAFGSMALAELVVRCNFRQAASGDIQINYQGHKEEHGY
jgi:hypothetical protein